jgi:hypothetical protein
MLQPLTGNDKLKRNTSGVKQSVGRASSREAHEVSWTDLVCPFVDDRLTGTRKDVDAFFLVEMPVIFRGLTSWLNRYKVEAELGEVGQFAQRPFKPYCSVGKVRRSLAMCVAKAC